MTKSAKPTKRRWDEVLDRLPEKKAVSGVEVGVWQAKMSVVLLRERPRLKLYLVDRWMKPHPGDTFHGTDQMSALKQEDFDTSYQIAKLRLSEFGDRAIILKGESLAMAQAVENKSLDFAFIDADHSYEGVKSDIEAWLPKVKKGGFISGHDYYLKPKPQKPNVGVRRAVDEKFGKAVQLGANNTWFVVVK